MARGATNHPSGPRARVHRALRRALPRPAYDRARLAYGRARVRAGRARGRGRLLPDFLLIGAPKGGSTTLHAWLAAHPYVVPSSTKEVHYFDYGYYHGEDWYRAHFPAAAEREAFAREHGRPFITGESSPTYLSHRWAPERVAGALPDVRLLLVLRNPIDRAFSQYQMSVREGHEKLSFEDAVAREDERLAPDLARAERDRHTPSLPLAKLSYLHRSRYADQLERWLTLYPRERFHVCRSEDLDARPGPTLAAIYEFLGLPAHEPPALPHLHTATYEPMAETTRAQLVERFRADNARLSQLVGFDVDWDR